MPRAGQSVLRCFGEVCLHRDEVYVQHTNKIGIENSTGRPLANEYLRVGLPRHPAERAD